MADIFEQDMIFAEVVKEVTSVGGIISPQLPHAKWRYIEGNFTPDQLRIIADRIEREFK